MLSKAGCVIKAPAGGGTRAAAPRHTGAGDVDGAADDGAADDDGGRLLDAHRRQQEALIEAAAAGATVGVALAGLRPAPLTLLPEDEGDEGAVGDDVCGGGGGCDNDRGRRGGGADGAVGASGGSDGMDDAAGAPALRAGGALSPKPKRAGAGAASKRRGGAGGGARPPLYASGGRRSSSSSGGSSGGGTSGGGNRPSSAATNTATGTTATTTAVGAPIALDDLEDLGVVGSGSSGVVRKVRHRPTGEALVVKAVQLDVGNARLRRLVASELRALAGARHPHVVAYRQSYLADGAVTILMEWMDAGSLADLLARAPRLPERLLAEVARQAAGGLAYLHDELRIVHRDIKPSNLLLTSGKSSSDSGGGGAGGGGRRSSGGGGHAAGRGSSGSSSGGGGGGGGGGASSGGAHSGAALKISDFGVSGQLSASVSKCASWVGTVTYMSPERIRGDAYAFDSDVWVRARRAEGGRGRERGRPKGGEGGLAATLPLPSRATQTAAAAPCQSPTLLMPNHTANNINTINHHPLKTTVARHGARRGGDGALPVPAAWRGERRGRRPRLLGTARVHR